MFYTNVYQRFDTIYCIGYENGVRFQRKYNYSPYLFVNAGNKNTKYKSVYGNNLERLDFESISEAKKFIERYDDVENFPIYGLRSFLYTFINDHFNGEIKYDPSLISVVNIDIETDSEDGFPNIEKADKKITAITIKKKNKAVVFGYFDYKTSSKDIVYIKCKDEEQLLTKFLTTWSHFKPDVVTGWNIEFFDIPYIINRCYRILGEKETKVSLSPWGIIDTKTINVNDKPVTTFSIAGISILDYLQLYKKFSYTPQETYKLDHIAHEELKENKLDYSEYKSLHDLYVRDFQKFINYNIHDVVLVEKLDDKLKFIEQVYALAYDAKVNFIDTFTSVKMWDVIIHNYLLNNDVVVEPMKAQGEDDRRIVGGYVKEPQKGLHKWVVSFDLNSLYPHLIQQFNISPETIQNKKYSVEIEDIIGGKIQEISHSLKQKDVVMAATGYTFTNEKVGFLAQLMEKMYNDRTVYKHKMLEAKSKYEIDKTYDLEKDIARYHNMQLAKKIQLNSAYGSLCNKFFRWFDTVLGESITMSGQLVIRWIDVKINEYLNALLKTNGVDYVIASDTDSIYLCLEKLVEKNCQGMDTLEIVSWLDKFCKDVFEPFIEEQYQNLAGILNAEKQKMKMKREAIADKGIWIGKKRYVLNVYNNEGVQFKDPMIKMVGIEAVRSSTPNVCRQKIKDAIKLMLTSTEKHLQDFIQKFKMEYTKMSFEDVAFPRGVNGIDKYQNTSTIYNKATPIHVRASLLYNKLIEDRNLGKTMMKIGNGDKIKYAYLKMPNPIKDNVIASLGPLPTSLGLDSFIDYETQFSKSFIEPIDSILKEIGWSYEKKSTLASFFK